MNQEQEQSLGQLHFRKTPLSVKVLIARKRSFAIMLSGLVFVFFIMMGLLVPNFWKIWPAIIFVELCIFAPLAASLWAYERWKFDFFLYECGIVVEAKGILHIAKYEDIEITKITGLLSRKGGGYLLAPSTYTLKLADGFTRRIHLGCEEYGEYQKMTELALQFSYQVILPKFREKLNAGENLEFGVFHLSRDGIQCNGENFLWADGYFVKFKYHLGEFSTGTFKVMRENSGMLANQPSRHYMGVNHALVFIDLLKSMNKFTDENITNRF